MKKTICLVLSLIMILSLAACQSKDIDKEVSQITPENIAAEETGDEVSEAGPYKIGIVTPTLSTSEDEFRAGAEMVERYPDIVRHITLPENFSAEIETGMSQILSLADDAEMKAIIVNSG